MRWCAHQSSGARFNVRRSDKLVPRCRLAVPLTQQRLGSLQVLFGIDADGVAWRRGYINVDAVIEQAQLLEAFHAFHPRGSQCGEALQGGLAVGVDAEVLTIAGESFSVAVERDGRAGKVKGAAIERGDYL